MGTGLIAPSPDQIQQTMSQPAQATPAPDSGGKPSFWKSLLSGALTGLAGAKGATSFGGGLAGGAQAEMQAQQQQTQNQLAQAQSSRADQEEQDRHSEQQTRMAQMQLNNRILSNQLHALDPHDPAYVQKTVNKLADQGNAGIAAGALIKTPQFDSAAEAEKYAQENHLTQGNYQVRVSPFRDSSGNIKYAGIEYDNAPSTKDVQVGYLGPDGKEVNATIPAGTPKSKIAELQVAAAKQQVESQFKKKDQELKDQSAAIDSTAQLLVAKNPDGSYKVAPSQVSKRGKEYNAALMRATELDPNYNPKQVESTFVASKALDKAFTSGKEAQNLTQFNTAADHLNQLDSLTDALGNGDTQALNKLANNFATATGSAAPTNFEAVRNAAVGEVAKVFSGGNVTEGQIKEIQKPLEESNSPQQLKGAITQLRNLMASKKTALQNQYDQGKSGKPAFDSAHDSAGGNKKFKFVPGQGLVAQ